MACCKEDCADNTEHELNECSTCWTVFEQTSLYTCVSCFESEITQSQKLYYCQNCVLIHIRKEHKIVDYNGLEPAVCDLHQNLCLLFCNTCDLIFCFNCLSSHLSHTFCPVAETACQVRQEVIENLDQVSEKGRLVSTKENEFFEAMASNEQEINELYEFVQAKFKRLRLDLSKKVADLLFSTSQNRVPDEYRTMGNLLQQEFFVKDQLAELLQQSDSHLVKNFLEKKNSFEKFVGSQNYSKELGIYARGLSINEDHVNECVDRLVDQFFRDMMIPKLICVEKCDEVVVIVNGDKFPSTDQSQFSDDGSTGFFLEIVPASLKTEIIKWTVSKTDSGAFSLEKSTIATRYGFTSSLKSVHKAWNDMVLIMENNSCFSFDSNRKQLFGRGQSTINFSKPYKKDASSQTIYWAYWNDNEGLIKLTHNNKLVVESLEAPPPFVQSFASSKLLFLNSRYDIVIVDLENDSVETVSQKRHSLLTIDQAEIIHEHLFLWDVKPKLLLVLKKGRNNWDIVKAVKWERSSSVFAVQVAECEFKFIQFEFISKTEKKCAANEDGFRSAKMNYFIRYFPD